MIAGDDPGGLGGPLEMLRPGHHEPCRVGDHDHEDAERQGGSGERTPQVFCSSVSMEGEDGEPDHAEHAAGKEHLVVDGNDWAMARRARTAPMAIGLRR